MHTIGKPPTATMLVSLGSCLAILVLISIALMGNTVHTSDIEINKQPSSLLADEQSLFKDIGAVPATIQSQTESSSSRDNSNSDGGISIKRMTSIPPHQENRRGRSGRLYGGGSATSGAQSQAQPADSYAAAYAAVQSADQTAAASAAAHQAQQQQQQSDVGAYNSFGETNQQLPPTQSSSGHSPAVPNLSPALVARQLSALSNVGSSSLQSDYSAVPSSSSYYANVLSPSSIATGDGAYSASMTNNYHTGANHQPSSYSNHHSHQERYAIPPTAPSHHNYYKSNSALPLGYPSNAYSVSSQTSGYYDRMGHSNGLHSSYWPMSSFAPSSSAFPSTSLMSSATHALSHWTNGFTIGEIVCGLVAISIGAVILGAPFFLIYLALMGNFSGSGTLSLTNPTAASGAAAASGSGGSPANGRRKRLATFEQGLTLEDRKLAAKHLNLSNLAEMALTELSPFVDLQQVSNTFKQLVRSIERHSNMKDEASNDANKAKKTF